MQFTKLRYLLFGGERVSVNHVSKFRAQYPDVILVHVYGPTENTTFSSYCTVEDIQEDAITIPIGKPVSNTQLFILDDDQRLSPVGVPGEIYTGGDGVARGYLNQPDLTAEKFISDPFHKNARLYRTGDIGRWLPDGNIEFIGRKDDQVKIRGYRIELGEIESALQSYAGVESVVVIARSNSVGEKELVAYLSGDEILNTTDIVDHLSRLLPSYMLPSYYVQLASLPLTINGKIDKKALPDPEGLGMQSGAEYIAPGDETERKLVKIWEEILGKERIGIREDFFELGGHSLKATRLASQIYKEFDVKVEIRDLFFNVMVEDQARLIREAGKTFFINIAPVAAQSSYVLSSAQRRLWVLSQFEDGNVAYNMPGAQVFEGELDRDGLEYAFRTLVDRHESLRTVFRSDDQGEIRQYILSVEESGFRVEYEDLRLLAHREEEVKLRVQQDFLRPFDLSEGPLLRATLYQLEDSRWVFSYPMHHIISDGWSMGLLIRELLLFYKTYVEGGSTELEPLRIQYKDYAVWQQEQLKGEGFEQHRQYWLDQFSGELPVVELPSDRVRPWIKSYNGGTVNGQLDKELVSGLSELSHQRGATLFMSLLSAVNALLYRYSHQSDIIIGSPIAGREHADLENQIGFYVNMLALRTRFSGEDSYIALLDKVKQVTLEGYAHQAYPFDELVEQVYTNADTGRHPLFDVVVVLQNINEETPAAHVQGQDPLHLIDYETDRVVSLFDMRFAFKERNDEINFLIEYNSDIYDRETAARMARHLEQIIKSIIQQPYQSIDELDYISDAEKIWLAFNTPEVGYPSDKTLVDLFEEQVNKTPDHVALVFEGEHYTYRQLNEKVNQLAHFLVEEIELQKEEGVGLLLARNPHSVISMLAILKAGGMYVPMESDTPEDRLSFIVSDSQLRIVITEKSFIEIVNRLQWSVPCLQNYLCIDSADLYLEKEEKENLMMNEDLWNHVGREATDQITGGGWSSSFTGDPIPDEEMEEYAMNAYKKLSPYLHKDMRVLEIGCSSGLTLNKIAPHVALYYGTDLSPVILEKTRRRTADQGITNVKFECLVADEIALVKEKDFDLVIINSVVQHFHGHNYLRRVIRDAINLLNDEGRIFIGDVMDIEKKAELIGDLETFKVENKGKGYLTKTDFSAELFLAKGFFHDLVLDEKEITAAAISSKIYTIENELTKYRYDVILQVYKESDKTSPYKRNKYQFSNTAISNREIANPVVKIKPSDLAYMIYTSGTTGKPKGVLVEHRNVVRLFRNDKPLFDFNDRDVWSMFHSYCFDFSVWEMYGALLSGGKLVIVPSLVAKDPNAFRELLIRENVTVLNQTPSSFYNVINAEFESETPELNVRYVIFGGEALSPGKLNNWRNRYPQIKLINMYGITETTVHVTYKEITEREIEINSSSIGKAIPTLRCYVLDQKQHLLPVGLAGELYVGGDGVSRGYLNREELTKERFISNPFKAGDRLYRSGDKVKLLPNGEIEFIGRKDDQVKIRGYRIELGEIESALQSYAGVESVVVIARSNSVGEKELVAYLSGDEILNTTDIVDHLSRLLPSYMLPSYYVQLASLPLTINGKIDKKALPDPEGLGMQSGAEYIAPGDETERKLVKIWEEILGKERIGIREDFFELGGHSLKATRLASQIYKEFDVKVEIRDLFFNVMVEDQARLIREAGKTFFINIAPVAAQSSYVLSSAQRRLWVLSQFEDGNVAYNMPGAQVFEGELDRDGLEYAFRTLVDRHESLRTVFRSDDQGEIRQYILSVEESGFRVEYEDLRLLAHREEEVKLRVQQDFLRPFDLSEGPLLRATLYQLEDSRWVFSYPMHHIISDGWSMGLLIRELLLFYKTYVEGGSTELEPLRIQYKDYAVWQQEQLKGEGFEQHRQYWLDQFSGELPVVELPSDRVRPWIKSYNGGTVNGQLDKELVSGLSELSHQRGATLFMSLLSAVNALLYRYSHQSDIIIGSPIAGREHADLENQIGFYVNMLALRTRFSGEDSYIALLDKVKQVTLEGYAHQAYPFDELVEGLGLQRDRSRMPLFDIVVVLQNMDNGGQMDAAQEEPSKIRAVSYQDDQDVISRFDLTFSFEEREGVVRMSIEYNSDIYSREMIVRLRDHFIQLVRSIGVEPEKPLSELEYLSEKERVQLLHEFNDTQRGYASDSTLTELFEKQVSEGPERIALVFEEKAYSYGELNEKANRLGHYLRSRGVGVDDRVGILLGRSAWQVISILGVLKSGGAYVPLDMEYPQDRIGYMLEDSGCKVVIDEREIEKFQLEEHEYEPGNPVLVNSPGDLAYVIYTSGSTGRPKGVMIEHKSVVNLCCWHNANFSVTENDRATLYAGAAFDASVWELFPYLIAGASLYIVPADMRLITHEMASWYENNKITISFLPTQIAEQFLYTDNSSLRCLLTGGDKLDSFLRKPYKVVNNYGPTECTVVATSYFVHDQQVSIPIGSPIFNTQIYIVNDKKDLAPIGVIGEICIGGDSLARGYLNQPELTAQKFIANPFRKGERMYRTGDLGRWLADGNIEFIGRKDDQVKIRGIRIELGEIENALHSHEDINDAVVMIKINGNNEKELVAYIVCHPGLDLTGLRNWLTRLLPAYMIPSRYIQLTELPLTPNGKIDKRALPEPERLGLTSGVEYVAPRNEVEEKLAEIWKEILGLEKIGVNDDFFHIGGHSLNTTRLSHQIQKELDVKLSVQELFMNPTIESQAQAIIKLNWLKSNVEMDNEIMI